MSSAWGDGELVLTGQGLHACDPTTGEVISISWSDFHRNQLDLGRPGELSQLTVEVGDGEPPVVLHLDPRLAATVINAAGRHRPCHAPGAGRGPAPEPYPATDRRLPPPSSEAQCATPTAIRSRWSATASSSFQVRRTVSPVASLAAALAVAFVVGTTLVRTDPDTPGEGGHLELTGSDTTTADAVAVDPRQRAGSVGDQGAAGTSPWGPTSSLAPPTTAPPSAPLPTASSDRPPPAPPTTAATRMVVTTSGTDPLPPTMAGRPATSDRAGAVTTTSRDDTSPQPAWSAQSTAPPSASTTTVEFSSAPSSTSGSETSSDPDRDRCQSLEADPTASEGSNGDGAAGTAECTHRDGGWRDGSGSSGGDSRRHGRVGDRHLRWFPDDD